MDQAKSHEALQLGVRGETYAYWYLQRLGYIFIARNYMPSRVKGELDLIGYDGDTLAIEVRTHPAQKGHAAQLELRVRKEKHEVLVRTAHYFLRERHIQNCCGHRDTTGQPPSVRLHKAALSPQVPCNIARKSFFFRPHFHCPCGRVQYNVCMAVLKPRVDTPARKVCIARTT